jgi:hypothetical protein
MKCISCEIEINPKWRHAVEINVCPFCGQHILEEHLKNLLTSLGDTMEKLQSYPDQLNDWLLSNYSYIKTDSPDLLKYVPKDALKDMKKEIDDQDFQDRKKFTVKVKTETGEEEVEAETLQSEDKTSEFSKRAGVIRPKAKDPKEGFKSVAEKTAYLKNVKSQIETEGSQGIVSEDGLAAMISPSDMKDQADPEAVAAMQSMLAGGDMIASGLAGAGTGEEEELPAAVLAMANRAKGNKNIDPNADLAKLQEMHARINNSHKNFESGENRGGKGGGFSRA